MDSEDRIARLEAEVRSLRRWILIAAVIFVAFAARSLKAPTRSELAAPFRIVDSKRQVVLTVDANDEGPRLSLFNTDGKPVLRLQARDTGATVEALASKGEALARLEASTKGGNVYVTGPDPRGGGAGIGAGRNGGGLNVSDPAGVSVFDVGREEDGTTQLTLAGEKGTALRVSADPSGTASMDLFTNLLLGKELGWRQNIVRLETTRESSEVSLWHRKADDGSCPNAWLSASAQGAQVAAYGGKNGALFKKP